MLFAIPIGYFVSIFLFISGVLNCMEYLQNKPVNCTRATLLNGIVEAGWPIIAATIILLLIQVCRQLERLRLESQGSEPARATTRKKAARLNSPAAEMIHRPAAQAGARPQAQAPQQPVYPNSPIPGGGRVPQYPTTPGTPPPVTTASTPPPPHPEPAPQPHVVKRAPNKQEGERLSFFKVD